jgi:DNA-binding LacI/PurR family transcriptional regulator
MYQAPIIIGKNIGIISYNETPLKEVLFGGISVVTINYEELGRQRADLILQRKRTYQNTYSLYSTKFTLIHSYLIERTIAMN